MSAGTYDFKIEQGTTFSRLIQIFDVYIAEDDPDNEPANLTSWSARMQIRTKPQAVTPILSLSIGNGLTITDAINGKIVIDLTSVQTAALDFSCAYYDLELFINDSDPEIVRRELEGKISLSREVTR